jgi:hypothetical protein
MGYSRSGESPALDACTRVPQPAATIRRPSRDADPSAASALSLWHKRIYVAVTICVIAAACTSSAPAVQQMSAHNGVALISTRRPNRLPIKRHLVVRAGTDEYRSPRGT